DPRHRRLAGRGGVQVRDHRRRRAGVAGGGAAAADGRRAAAVGAVRADARRQQLLRLAAGVARRGGRRREPGAAARREPEPAGGRPVHAAVDQPLTCVRRASRSGFPAGLTYFFLTTSSISRRHASTFLRVAAAVASGRSRDTSVSTYSRRYSLSSQSLFGAFV